ncbi:MAG: hypothetical protein RLY31_2962 [Bacteroidota bacterium]|jgi:putative ABC transport system ATP-binding protein
MLKTSGLTYAYPGGQVLRFPDISCEKGEHWLLLGQSGCGKTTLLHLLGGLLTPLSGSVLLEGTDITSLPSGRLDRFRGRHIGIIFQSPHFVRSLSVAENLSLARQLAGLPPAPEEIMQLLERLGIGNKAATATSRLSQGERQRVAIARALVNKPSLILADEPTASLDDRNTGEVIRLLEHVASEVRATLLVVTHDKRLKDHFTRQVTLG